MDIVYDVWRMMSDKTMRWREHGASSMSEKVSLKSMDLMAFAIILIYYCVELPTLNINNLR